MEESIGNAVIIMVVGMVTVFLILWLVGIIGNSIIRLTNRYIVVTEPVLVKTNAVQTDNHKNKVAAIVAAVEMITGGKGTVMEIEKV